MRTSLSCFHLARPLALGIAATLAASAWAQSPPETVEDEVVGLDELQVEGATALEAAGELRDLQGHDDVYGLDITTAYIGRKEVERYKGTTPSDILNGLPGVYSGDARNSGALDVSIRGMQGPGRVPVTIDGTEQALTVWRGYNGIGNRNYIDPNLIGGLQVVKTPGLMRDVNIGVGGAVVVKTLDADDVIAEGNTFGMELKLEGSSNAVAPRIPPLLTGMDYRDVPELVGKNIWNGDPTVRVHPDKHRNAWNVFDGEDHAWRLALGWRPTQQFDLVAAYAYRDRGNYYSGKRNSSFYSQPIVENIVRDDWITHLTYRFTPGEEVLNTSIRMESWLAKATWRPTAYQIVRFGYRDSLTHNGEILPSRILEAFTPDADGMPQWPLSRVSSKAYNLEYQLQPPGHRWLDLRANLWRTQTKAASYNSGPYINYWDNNEPIIVNGAMRPNDNPRNGISLSNRFSLTDTFGITLSGSFQNEKLRSEDNGVRAAWLILPRAGRREEWQASLNLDWQPLTFLTLNAGVRYQSYWSFDDYLAANEGKFINVRRKWAASYYTKSAEEVAEYREIRRGTITSLYEFLVELGIVAPEDVPQLIEQGINNAVARWNGNKHTIPWEPDSRGNWRRADNPCLNGMVTAEIYGIIERAGPHADSLCYIDDIGITSTAAFARDNRDHGWVPSLSLSVQFSDNSRMYLRYDELLRFPSMFGSLLSFSAGFNPYMDKLRPEHAYNYELGYIYSFGHRLRHGSIADIKLTGYVRKIRDLIERDLDLNFDNIDKQTMHGVEFQGRYDNGRLFTDLSISKTLKNRVCDESSALWLDMRHGRLPDCVDEGFVGSYLMTQAVPELSATWSLGGRFLDHRMEAGGRVVFYEKRKTNKDLLNYIAVVNPSGYSGAMNKPFSWDTLVLLDTYISYRIKDHLQVELVATNLTDQFYADPATRSLMPAPGRTLKLSFTATF